MFLGEYNIVKLSLIIPTWNATPYLEATLTTLREQTYPIHQIVVVDDKSDLGYAREQEEVCKRFDAEYIYFDAPEKLKRRSACNQLGLQVADGDIVGFCCVDMVYYSDYIEILMSVLEQYENMVLFHNTRGLPYFMLGTPILLVRKVVELIHSGEILKQIRTDNESKWYTYEEKWWSTIFDIHPTLYAWGCDGNAFLRTKYAKTHTLWDEKFVGYGHHCTDFAYSCLINGLSCVVLKDVIGLSVDHDKPSIIQKGTKESWQYFQEKWGKANYPKSVPLIKRGE